MAPRFEYRGFRHPFLMGTHFAGGVGDLPRTVADLAMSQFSAYLRSKPKWWVDYRESSRKWKNEGLRSSFIIRTPSGTTTTKLSSRQIDYVLEELAGYVALIDETHRCQVSCFERIWESDDLLDFADLSNLNNELVRFRDAHTLAHGRDGATEIIDPFLYSLVYGLTPVYDIHRPGALRRQPAPSYTHDYFVSQKFAFIPTDFFVSPTGRIKAISYINNLHPRETVLYGFIEDLLERCLPLFGHVLTDLHRNNPLYQRIKGACRYTEWDEPEPPDHSDDEDGWSRYERDVRKWVMQRPIQLPDVPVNGYQGGLETRRHVVDLLGKTLQIVVHVYDIQLDPSNPVYAGSPWHIEGMRNEIISACAFFYSSVENLMDNSLEFRMAVTSPTGFEAGDAGATTRTWAMNDGDPCHQYIGARSITTGLSIAFPNIYQHRHSSFKLRDPSKEGHQRLFVFNLVDPEVQPVISTSRVPPQQKSWIRAAAGESIDSRLPIELIERIVDEVEGKMTDDEAQGYRNKMIDEREAFRTLNEQYHFSVPFDIWDSNLLS